MKFSTTTLVLAALTALYASPAVGVAVAPPCTAEEAAQVQSIMSQKTWQPACPEVKFNADGSANLSDLAFCQNAKCIKAIKKTRKSLPVCKVDGVNQRNPLKKMYQACDAGSGSDDDDGNAGASPATVSPGVTPTDTPTTKAPKTPKPTTVKPSKTPKPSKDTTDDEAGSGSTTKKPKSTKAPTGLYPTISGHSTDGSEENSTDSGSSKVGKLIDSEEASSTSSAGDDEAESTSLLSSASTAPTTAPTSAPQTSTTTKSSAMAPTVTVGVTVVSTMLWALLA